MNKILTIVGDTLKTKYVRRIVGLITCVVTIFNAANAATVAITNNTSTTPALASTYTSLASAITALNTVTVFTAPVTITCTGTETAPAGGYSISFTGTASAANNVTIVGTGVTITAPTPQTSGNLNDAIFKIIGSDFVTIQGFTMLENTANTTIAAGTNNMTEFGVALFYATTTNGAQNCTILNNTITLNKTYQNTFGIYSTNQHSATVITTAATSTTIAGSNYNLKIYGNAINNVNNGICIVGATAVADMNTGIDIGGTSLSTGNSITNWGTTGTFSGYSGVSGTMNGIQIKNCPGSNISFNTIASATTGVTAGTMHGIQQTAMSTTIVGTTTAYTYKFNSNNISLKQGLITGAMNGITLAATAANVLSSVEVNSNNFSNFGWSTATASGFVTFISGAGIYLNQSFSNNTWTNIDLTPSSGGVTLITDAISLPSGATQNINNNSIVGTFSKTGTGGNFTFFTTNSSSVAGSIVNINNNNISNVSLLGGSSTFVGINNTDGGVASSPTKSITGNTFNNITTATGIINAMTCNYFGGFSSVSTNTITNITTGASITALTIGSSSIASSLDINNNIINTISSSGGSVTGYANASPTATGHNSSGNIINNLSCSFAGGVVTGINLNGATSINLFKNKIYALSTSNASGSVAGITNSAGTTSNIYNNIIGDLTAPAANAANPVIGLNISGGTTVNAYYNTINIAGTSSGALFGSSAVFASTATTVTLRNNIFVNNGNPTGAGLCAAYRRSATAALSTYSAASNNNLFFGTTLFTDGTITNTTLSTLKATLTPSDASSVTENPSYLSTVGSNANFLHINTTIATQLESGGSAVAGITDDYDAQVRNVSTPDIGADEFTGIIADLTAPLITYTALGTTCNNADRTLTATITDASGVPSSGAGLPVLYWKINAGAYTAVTGTFVSGSTYTFSFGAGAVNPNVVSYYIVAQDNNSPTPNVGATPGIGAAGFTISPPAVSTPPTSPSTYSIATTLSGTYNVGASGAYPTLTAAIAAYHASCLGGPVVFNLTDANYSTSETFPIVINQHPDANVTNTLTIKPATTATITSAVGTGALIKWNGADYVNIDGSNSGGTDRSLTIINSTTTTSGNAVLWLTSLAAGNGANNNIIKNCILEGNASTTTFTGIHLGGTSIGLTTAGLEKDNFNTINNNLFRKMQYGVTMFGFGAATPDSNNVISNNKFGTATAGEGFSIYCINADRQSGLVISGNEVQNVIGSGSLNITGIRLLDFKNGKCFNNNVHDISYTGTSTIKTYGIMCSSSSYTTVGNPSNAMIYNNMVSNILSAGTSATWNASGIAAGAGFGDKYYHNTVNMSGQLNNSASGLAAAFSNGDPGLTAFCTNIDVRNNILNVSGSSNLGGNVWAISTQATTLTGSIYNNNDLRCAATSTGTAVTNNIGRFNGISYNSLASWQTATGQEANSVSVTPIFTSTTDLHLLTTSNAGLNNLGANLGINTDIDGETRNVSNPDMGVDEFIPCMTSPIITAIPTNLTLCLGQSITLSETASDATAWLWSTTATTNSITVSPATTTTYNLTASKPAIPGCSTTVSVVVNVNPVPTGVTATASNPTFCIGGSTNLSSSPSVLPTTILSEGFETGATGWLFIDSASTGSAVPQQIWQIQSAPYTDGTGSITYSNFTTGSGKFAYANPDAGGSGSITKTIMVSPSFSTVGYSGNASLTFKNMYKYWSSSSPAEEVKVEITTNNGTTWNTLINYNGADVGTTTNNAEATVLSTVSIPAIYMGLPNVKLRWKYYSNWGYSWIVDDILLSGNSAVTGVSWASFPVGYSNTTSSPTGISPTTSTNYIVTASNAFGCTASSSITVTVNPLPTPTYTISNVSCFGGTNGKITAIGSITGTAPYIYKVDNIAYNSNGTYGASTHTITVTDANGCTNNVGATITQPTQVTSSITSPASLFVCNGATTTYTVNAAGGTAPYHLSASASSTFSAASVYTVGGTPSGSTYTADVIDANGCTPVSDPTITITERSPVVATATLVSGVACNGGTATYTVTAIGGSNAGWAGTVLYTVTPNPSAPSSTFTNTVTDDEGCTGISTITIAEPTLLTASLASQTPTNCYGESNGTATIAVPTTGTAPYTYNGGASTTITGLSAGTQTITVSDANNCQATVAVTITQPAAVSASIASQTPTNCYGESNGSVSITATGGNGGYTYSGSSSNSITGLSAGSNPVTVVDNKGCTVVVPVTILQPAVLSAAIAGQTPASCNGNADGTATILATGGNAGYTYNGGSSTVMTGLTAGVNTFSVIDIKGCSTTVSASITQPAVLTLNVAATNTIACYGGTGTYTITVAGGNIPQTLYTINSLTSTVASLTTSYTATAGTYTHMIQDAKGCQAINTITLTQPTPVTASIAQGAPIACNGGSSTYTVSANGGTIPYRIGTSATFNPSKIFTVPSGIYTNVVTDANGCTALASGSAVFVDPPILTVAASAIDSTILVGSQLDLLSNSTGGAISYAWSGPSSAGTASTQNHTITATTLADYGIYTVTVVNATGCTAISTVVIEQNRDVNVKLKVLLSGPLASSGLMNDDLRNFGLIPNMTPYNFAPYSSVYSNVNNAGFEMVNPGVLSASGSDAIVDWVWVELRDKTNWNTIVGTRSALIQRDGDVVDMDGTSPVLFGNVGANDYYISVKHRNHSGIMGANSYPLSFSVVNQIDFTNTATPLYAKAAPNNNPSPLSGPTRTIGGKRALYAGNAHIGSAATSKVIYYNSLAGSDRTAVFNVAGLTGTVSGYSANDVNMDGITRFNGLNPDRLVILLNCANSNFTVITEQTPN